MYSNNTKLVIILTKPEIIDKIEKKSEELRVSKPDVIKIALAEYFNGDGAYEWENSNY